MHELVTPMPLLASPHIGFFALIIIGGLAGWIAGMVSGSAHGIFTNILIGIAGSWLGSKIAELLNFAPRGTMMQLLVAILGSIVILVVWRAVSPPPNTTNA